MQEVALGDVTGASIAEWMMRAGQEAHCSLQLSARVIKKHRAPGADGAGWPPDATGEVRWPLPCLSP